MTDKELRKFVESNLSPGDNRQQIESFFDSQGWSYDFNRFGRFYSVHYKEGDIDHLFEKSGVGVYVYINENNHIQSIEIKRIYTGL